MKKLFLLGVIFLAVSAQAEFYTDCLKSYADKNEQEYNLPNEFLVSKLTSAKIDVIKVIKMMGFTKSYVVKAEKAISQAAAVGTVIVFEDEIKLKYFGISRQDGGKCQVQFAIEVNTADLNYSEFSTAELNKFFLNINPRKLPRGTKEIYSEIKSNLAAP